MTANIHQLLHFADSVRHLGPLWAHSTFPFENLNGVLRKLFHGSRTPDVQVIYKQQLTMSTNYYHAEIALCRVDCGVRIMLLIIGNRLGCMCNNSDFAIE